MEHETIKIFLALLCVGLVIAYPYAAQDFLDRQRELDEEEKRVQYCGSRLSATISVVCGGYYNSYLKATTEPKFLSRREAKSIIRRKRRGIINECCRNSCTIRELRSFCGRP